MKKILPFAILITAILISSCKSQKEQVHERPSEAGFVVIGYVPGYGGILDEKTIDANKLTHINYAFVDVKDSMAWLTNLETDSINFRNNSFPTMMKNP